MRAPGFILCLISSFALAACSTPAKTPAAPELPAFDVSVIDAHTHTDFTNQPETTSGIMQSREQYFKEWREANVVGAVSHSPYSAIDGQGKPRGPETDLREEGVMHCFGLPGGKLELVKIEQALKSKRYGCLKVYLGYVHQFASDRSYLPAYKLAEKYDVPVVFHTGDIYMTSGKLKYAEPMTVDEIAVDFPRVNFVIAHCGNPWIETAAEIAYKNPNVSLECSAMMIGNFKEIPRENLQRYLIDPISWIFHYVEDPKKIMFGTDWPLVGIKDYIDVYRQAIPPEHWRAVFHDNAVRIFKLKPRTTKP